MIKIEKTIKLTLLILSIIFLFPTVSKAVTGSISPSTALPGQMITVSASWFKSARAKSCAVSANFGDNTILTIPCTNSVNVGSGIICSGMVQHGYTYPGSYMINVFNNNCPGDSPSQVRLPVRINCPALALITSGELPSGKAGKPYTALLQTSGGTPPLMFLLNGSLPPGLALNASTGMISGTPTVAGNYNFGVTVSDSCPFGARGTSENFTILINCADLSILSPDTLPSGTVGSSYNYQMQADGGAPPYKWNIVGGSLPAGLNLSNTGIISGIPQSRGTFRFTASVEDSCPNGKQNTQKSFVLSINSDCPEIVFDVQNTLPFGKVGEPYSYSITTSGGTPPLSFSIVNGSLPPGLTFNSNGIISGTPSSAGTYNFAVRATDSCPEGPRSKDINLSLTIKPSTLKIFVTISPSSFRVPRGIGGTQSLSYTATATPPLDMKLFSSEGIFVANGKEIGSFNAPLKINILNGIGHAYETISFPVSVLKRAEKLGITKINFRRTFIDTTQSYGSPVVIESEMIITTEAGADLRINRMQLYFDNGRAEITVNRNDPNLKAYVDIRFTGSGLLDGYWEVDGRILSYVKQHVVYGRSVTFETPETPPIPTFDTGTHILRFVLTNPGDVPVPEAIYFVTPVDYLNRHIIPLVSPEDKSKIEFLPPKFTWERVEGISVYLIELYEKDIKKPIFSALTRKTEYKVPHMVFEKIFKPGAKYRWKVKGFAESDAMIGESSIWSFHFSRPQVFVPGQVLIVTMEENGRSVIEKITQKYNLIPLRTFVLKTLQYRIDIMKTDEDVKGLIEKISKEKGVVQVQPNYILRTLSEPMSDMQRIRKILNMDILHNHYNLTGKGVLVAIIDTGVDSAHRDLKKNLKVIKNFVPDSPYLNEIHGTAMAGIIAAATNGFGITGIAPEAGIIALRACRQVSETSSMGECYSSTVSQALDVAILSGAKVVNLSIGSSVPDSLLVKVIEKGAEKGVIFVAPSGNRTYQTGLIFPASHPDVIAVGGIDTHGRYYPNDIVVDKSDVIAPSENIFTTIPGNRHNFLSGTSVSSAIVSGLMALALEKNPEVNRKNLPVPKKNICQWEEKLLGIKICI